MAFRSPYCQSEQLPVVRTRVSTTGWIVLVVLIFACLPLCWIGLFIKEEYRICSACGIPLGAGTPA